MANFVYLLNLVIAKKSSGNKSTKTSIVVKFNGAIKLNKIC